MDNTRSFDDVFALMKSKSPLMLDEVTVEMDKETGKPAEFRFSDDHEFTVTLPAWVFRAFNLPVNRCP